MGARSSQIPVLLMTEEQKSLLNKPEAVKESSGFHLSKPYFKHGSKSWVQKKVHASDSEKKQTYRKELEKMGESYSFKSFILEDSALLPDSQYTPEPDIKSNKSGMGPVDVGNPRRRINKNINKAFSLFLKADPMSS